MCFRLRYYKYNSNEVDTNTYYTLIEWMKTFEEVSKDEKTFAIVFGNKTDLPQDRSEFERVKL